VVGIHGKSPRPAAAGRRGAGGRQTIPRRYSSYAKEQAGEEDNIWHAGRTPTHREEAAAAAARTAQTEVGAQMLVTVMGRIEAMASTLQQPRARSSAMSSAGPINQITQLVVPQNPNRHQSVRTASCFAARAHGKVA
jgi:microcystin-dependent protein